MHAVRNIRLCTKDCLCLYVCPTGATDTENGQIDAGKCLSGCRACVDACPSNAISLVPDEFPAQQEKAPEVVASLMSLLKSKTDQEYMAESIAVDSDDPIVRQLAKTLAQSCRIQAEDIIREAGFMLPQSDNAKEFLKSLFGPDMPEDMPKDAVTRLLKLMDE